MNQLCVRLEERYFFTILTQLRNKNNQFFFFSEARGSYTVNVVNGRVFKTPMISHWVTFNGCDGGGKKLLLMDHTTYICSHTYVSYFYSHTWLYILT